LAPYFREVVLVDIIHPMGVRWYIRKWKGVHARAADVTGAVEAVFRAAQAQGSDLPHVLPDLFCDDPDVDLVASVNLLSHLAFLPAKYLMNAGTHDRDTITDFARDLIRSHLEYLRRLPGTVALIADVEHMKVDPAGTLVERVDMLQGVPLPWAGEEWIWNIAPRPEADWKLSHQRRVVGIANVKTALAKA
jgi:hypothetical protein